MRSKKNFFCATAPEAIRADGAVKVLEINNDSNNVQYAVIIAQKKPLTGSVECVIIHGRQGKPLFFFLKIRPDILGIMHKWRLSVSEQSG